METVILNILPTNGSFGLTIDTSVKGKDMTVTCKTAYGRSKYTCTSHILGGSADYRLSVERDADGNMQLTKIEHKFCDDGYEDNYPDFLTVEHPLDTKANFEKRQSIIASNAPPVVQRQETEEERLAREERFRKMRAIKPITTKSK